MNLRDALNRIANNYEPEDHERHEAVALVYACLEQLKQDVARLVELHRGELGTLPAWRSCPACHGTGASKESRPSADREQDSAEAVAQTAEEPRAEVAGTLCPLCQGKGVKGFGLAGQGPCTACHGTGAAAEPDIANVMDAVAESVEAMPDDQLLTETLAAGLDPVAVAEYTRNTMLEAIRKARAKGGVRGLKYEAAPEAKGQIEQLATGCNRCGGTGETTVRTAQMRQTGWDYTGAPCDACDGTGAAAEAKGQIRFPRPLPEVERASEVMARRFHELYESLAVPENNRELMKTVCVHVLAWLDTPEGKRTVEETRPRPARLTHAEPQPPAERERRIPDSNIDGAISVLREWMNTGADGESAHLVCDAVAQLRRDLARAEERVKVLELSKRALNETIDQLHAECAGLAKAKGERNEAILRAEYAAGDLAKARGELAISRALCDELRHDLFAIRERADAAEARVRKLENNQETMPSWRTAAADIEAMKTRALAAEARVREVEQLLSASERDVQETVDSAQRWCAERDAVLTEAAKAFEAAAKAGSALERARGLADKWTRHVDPLSRARDCGRELLAAIECGTGRAG